MESENNIRKLLGMSEAKNFNKGEYICHEGEMGEEMYLILQGRVSVRIHTFMDEVTEIAVMEAGGFFGEMAVFEKQPRSADCIALEDTSCIAVKRKNLMLFIQTYPDIAERMMESMGKRLREMNRKLYKEDPRKKSTKILPFLIPEGHRSSKLTEKTNPSYIHKIKIQCPICRKEANVKSIHNIEKSTFSILSNQRKVYDNFDILWNCIRTCPNCGYSNFYIDFFKASEMDEDRMEAVLEEEKKEACQDKATPFDEIIMKYYRAIHFNECMNGEDFVLLGKLWLYVGWLYEDAGMTEMSNWCKEKVIEYYTKTYTDNMEKLSTQYSRQQCAIILGQLYMEKGNYENAKMYYHEAAGYSNQDMRHQALERIYEIRETEDHKGGITN